MELKMRSRSVGCAGRRAGNRQYQRGRI